MSWYIILYIVLAVVIYLLLNSASVKVNGKNILNLKTRLLISLVAPLVLILLFVFLFVIFVVILALFVIFVVVLFLTSTKQKGIKKAKVVDIK